VAVNLGRSGNREKKGAGTTRTVLVRADMGVLGRDDGLYPRVEDAVRDELHDARSLLERAGQANERALAERRVPGVVQVQQGAELCVQVRVSEGVGRELVVEEVLDDVLGDGDGVQGHGSGPPLG
jgi:hypothetical protein